MAVEKMNAEKTEVVIGINSFDQPAEASETGAWVKIISRLLFMKKGTYPTDPEMGCELQKYEFAFSDKAAIEITEVIREQCQTYLPDIPLTSINVSTAEYLPGRNVLLISMEFEISPGQYNTVVVASEKTNKLINFEVAM